MDYLTRQVEYFLVNKFINSIFNHTKTVTIYKFHSPTYEI